MKFRRYGPRDLFHGTSPHFDALQIFQLQIPGFQSGADVTRILIRIDIIQPHNIFFLMTHIRKAKLCTNPVVFRRKKFLCRKENECLAFFYVPVDFFFPIFALFDAVIVPHRHTHFVEPAGDSAYPFGILAFVADKIPLALQNRHKSKIGRHKGSPRFLVFSCFGLFFVIIPCLMTVCKLIFVSFRDIPTQIKRLSLCEREPLGTHTEKAHSALAQ